MTCALVCTQVSPSEAPSRSSRADAPPSLEPGAFVCDAGTTIARWKAFFIGRTFPATPHGRTHDDNRKLQRLAACTLPPVGVPSCHRERASGDTHDDAPQVCRCGGMQRVSCASVVATSGPHGFRGLLELRLVCQLPEGSAQRYMHYRGWRADVGMSAAGAEVGRPEGMVMMRPRKGADVQRVGMERENCVPFLGRRR